MTNERIAELRSVLENNSIKARLMHECLDEIERLQTDNCAHGYALSALKREIGLGLDEQSEDYSEIAVKVAQIKGELKTIRETPVGVAVTQSQRLGSELAVAIADKQRLADEVYRLNDNLTKVGSK